MITRGSWTATIKDGAGNAANLTGAVTNPAGTLQIDTTVASLVASGTGITAGSGDLGVGKVVTLTLTLSEAVAVAGGSATYSGGSGSNALTFTYTVGAGQNTADLAVTAINLGTATIKDGAGNAANLTAAVTNPAGTPQITAPVESFGSTALDAVANSYLLSLVAGGTGPQQKYGGSLVAVGQFAGWTFIGAEQTAIGYEVALKATGANQYTVWNRQQRQCDLQCVGGIVSGSSSVLQGIEASFHQDLTGDGIILLSGSGSIIGTNSLVVGSGASVEFPGAYSGSVSFAGATGTLVIDSSANFTGKIGGQLATGDVIDLVDITAGAGATIGYSGNNSPGTLTVSDGTRTASIALLGNYSLGNFTASSDGHGGTSVVDPPLPTDQHDSLTSENSGSDPVDSLAAIDQRLALWSQHMASAFASSGWESARTSMAGAGELGGSLLPQLAQPITNQQHSGMTG